MKEISLEETGQTSPYSPKQILEEIQQRWTHYSQFDLSRVKIAIDKGEVILRGIVGSRQAKHIAGDMALAVPGVREVHNYLQIDPPPQRPGSNSTREDDKLKDPQDYRRETSIESPYPGYEPHLDQYSQPDSTYSEFWNTLATSDSNPQGEPNANERMAAEIWQRLQAQPHLKTENIKVAVNNGQVILKGKVDTSESREIADQIIGSVTGVSQIINQLQVDPN
jgi:osmotically-inducible protein OsmY